MMQRYVKKGTEREVYAAKLSPGNVKELAGWCEGQEVLEYDALDTAVAFVGLNIPTPEGMKRVSQGEYLVQMNGEFFAAKPGSFEQRFELIP